MSEPYLPNTILIKILDLLSLLVFIILLVGLHALGSYCKYSLDYKMIYYGIRMWLVFVLHSFSLCSFAELMMDNYIGIGLVFIGNVTFIIVCCYLFIQIYIYISFANSILDNTMLILFPSDICFHSSHIELISGFHSSALSMEVIMKGIMISTTYTYVYLGQLLIPVSLVDLFIYFISFPIISQILFHIDIMGIIGEIILKNNSILLVFLYYLLYWLFSSFIPYSL